MRPRVGTWRRNGLRSILNGNINRLCYRHLAVERPQAPLFVRLINSLPRMSRVMDVAIAGTIAYFWLCL